MQYLHAVTIVVTGAVLYCVQLVAQSVEGQSSDSVGHCRGTSCLWMHSHVISE